MTRTFTEGENDLDETDQDVIDNDGTNAEEEGDDNEVDPDAEEGENEGEEQAEATVKVSPDQLWAEVIDNIRSGNDNDAATFAAAFATSTKDAHGKLNELSNASMVLIARDNDVDPADKGQLLTEITLLVEAVHGIMPKRSATTSGADPVKIAADEVTRIVAVIDHIDALREDLLTQVRQQSIVAGLTTSDDLAAWDADDNGEWLPDVDSDSVTFTKKFAESLEYIASVPGGARQGAGGASAGADFSPGDVRFDNKGNAIRFDGTHYFVTMKGQPESGEKFTSSSTAAKKAVTGCETNGKKHFRYDSDPTKA